MSETPRPFGVLEDDDDGENDDEVFDLDDVPEDDEGTPDEGDAGPVGIEESLLEKPDGR